MKRIVPMLVVTLFAAACGGPKTDQLRTVKSWEFSSCESAPTTDATELAALDAFKVDVQLLHFVRDRDTLIAANHEATPEASGLRQYEGPFYLYLHPRRLEPEETNQGIEWIATAYLHAANVRTRRNGGEWSAYQRVRTRNFAVNTQTVGGLGRWQCLLNSEIAWATLSLRHGKWRVEPLAIGVYEGVELQRLRPLPTRAQIEGTETVQAMLLPSAVRSDP